MKVGLIVNPIAGMGGRVGLKGTDGPDILRKAIELGAKPWAEDRAYESMKVLRSLIPDDSLDVYTYPSKMGESSARRAGFSPRVIGEIGDETTAEDTVRAAKDMNDLGVDLILFTGGDGTARDVYRAIDEKQVVLGIPAGVKVYSSVFAASPRAAGELAARFLRGQVTEVVEAEVLDIDEDAFREGRLSIKLYGYLKIPYDSLYIPGGKIPSGHSENYAKEAAATEFIDNMEKDCIYIIGPGTTTKEIMKKLGLEYTLLGVDAIERGKLIGKDLNEEQIIDLIFAKRDKAKVKVVVSPIGGQGYIFGRGNQQISPKVLRMIGKENIIIIATPRKIESLRGKPMLIDTGDEELDEELSGYYRVILGYREYIIYKVVPGYGGGS